jgi:hypothetical protein
VPRLVRSPGGGLFRAPGGGLAAFAPSVPTGGSFTAEFTAEFVQPAPAGAAEFAGTEFTFEFRRHVTPPVEPTVGTEFTQEFTAEFQRTAIPLEPPPAPDPVEGVLLFTSTVENADAVATWASQELGFGQPFKPGDVPAGTAVRCLVDGAAIPTQLSNRVFWKDGSLKWAQVRLLVPSVAVGATKTLTWQRYAASWASHDAALHTATSAITGKVDLEYRFSSFRGRNAAGTLTAERGPKTFHSGTMLSSANAAWIDTVMAGRVCTEWRASDMAALVGGAKDASLGCLLYARAWGGTANNPRRIEFVFRTMYGWSDGVPSDQQGIRCSTDLLVNGTAVRGASLATPTPGWANRDSYNGGFYASPGPTGQADWFDVAANAFVTPPRLVHRMNVAYGVSSRFLPPYDTDNPIYAPQPTLEYQPQGRATLSYQQDNVGDHHNLPWTTSTPFVQAMIAHARRPVAEVVSQDRNCRVTAWALAALGSIGFNRTTRKLICHLPPAKNPDPTALGASVHNGTKPQRVADPALNPYVINQDAPHFPQVTWWTALTGGDQHILDLAYAEATLPGLFGSNSNGFYVTVPNPGGTSVAAGGIYFQGQTRGVGHAVRPILNVMAIGNPADPHHKLAKALWANAVEAREAHIRDQDYWRNTSQPADGRYFRDLKMYPMDPSQEPQYKIWMHSFSLSSTTYGYAITEDDEALRLAQWWAHVPTVLCGGWHNDSNYLMKPDPVNAAEYYTILASTGTGATNNDRRPWPNHGQWGNVSRCTYKADNQTVDLLQPAVNGMVITVTGEHTFNEPALVVDMTKIPGGLVRGVPYYSVQASGTTCKLATTLGGAPVTFSAGGADISGMVSRNFVFGAPGHTMKTGANVVTATTAYHVQLLASLDFYQHYVAPNDARVRLARSKMKALKTAAGGDYDVRAKTAVPP